MIVPTPPPDQQSWVPESLGGLDVPCCEPGLVVDAVIRLLVAERVPVTVNSVAQAEESAQRLLRDLGVQPAPASPNRVAWQALADAITGGLQ